MAHATANKSFNQPWKQPIATLCTLLLQIFLDKQNVSNATRLNGNDCLSELNQHILILPWRQTKQDAAFDTLIGNSFQAIYIVTYILDFSLFLGVIFYRGPVSMELFWLGGVIHYPASSHHFMSASCPGGILHALEIQTEYMLIGDQSGWSKPPFDIKTKVLFKYEAHVLKQEVWHNLNGHPVDTE